MNLLAFLCLFVTLFTSAPALLVLKDSNVKLNNTDFWFMPNDYDVTSTLVRAKFEEGEKCKVKISSEADGRVLFFLQADLKAAGCFFFHETIEAVKEINPKVTIYESVLGGDDLGYLTSEPYGNFPSYSASGLALTLVNTGSAAKIVEALEAGGPVNVSISYDVGNWVRFASSPYLQAYTAVFDIFYAVLLIYCVFRLALYMKDFEFSIPFLMFVLCSLCCICRILEISVNPFFLRNNTPAWVRYAFFWMGYVFGYAIFVMIGNSWMTLGAHLNVSPWMKKLTVHFIRFSYYSIGHLFVAAVLFIVQLAYPGNQPLMIVVGIAYFALVPIIAIEALILAGFGTQIVVTLQKSMAGNTSRSRLAYRKISFLLISSVMGFFFLAITIVLLTVVTTILGGTIVACFRELASIWMLVSIVYSITLHNARGTTTKKGTGSQVASTPKDTAEKSELETYASEAPW